MSEIQLEPEVVVSMSQLFEELDYSVTPIGAISLRKRRELSLGIDVFEIKLGDEFLMSSLFTASEIALAKLALAQLPRKNLEVLVGGLGLGYTAQAVLENKDVSSLIVIEMLNEVIEWHQSGLLPIGDELSNDPRCQIVQGDFFELAIKDAGFEKANEKHQFDAILVDIDHSPEALLDDRSSNFYRSDSIQKLTKHMKPGGVFGLWSDDRPDPAITAILQSAFETARAEPVVFYNPLQRKNFTQTVYLGFKG